MWKEVETRSGKPVHVSIERSASLTEAKKVSAPVLEKEASEAKTFASIKFQEVRGVDKFEGEFGVKAGDLIFHFWPDRYHEMERLSTSVHLPKTFLPVLTKSLTSEFGDGRFEVSEDKDVGAVFVKVYGLGNDLFWRTRAVNLCTELYKGLGGQLES